MQGLYSGFDAARAGWEFPEVMLVIIPNVPGFIICIQGICAGFLGYPSDPESDGLESNHKTGDTGPAVPGTLDNDPDTAVKVRSS